MAKVLVTGGAGFIGHHLVERLLLETRHEVISLDRLDFSGTLHRLSYLKEKYPIESRRLKILWHDLKAPIYPHIEKYLRGTEYIFHLAAGSHVDRSIDNPLEFVMDNVVGTCNLLNFAREAKVKLFSYFSTDEVFGPAPGEIKYKEWDRYNSGNPYSAAKAGAEELCVAFSNTYGIPMMITHCMNVFGIRQHAEKYVPLCIRKVLNGEKVYIHANKECTKAGSRFYIHTDDVVDAVLHLWELHDLGKLKKCDKFNIVGSEEIDNLDLAQRIAASVGKKLKYELVDFHGSRPGHDLRYALDGEKMKGLGWEPKDLTKRLNETVDWYLKEENKIWLET